MPGEKRNRDISPQTLVQSDNPTQLQRNAPTLGIRSPKRPTRTEPRHRDFNQVRDHIYNLRRSAIKPRDANATRTMLRRIGTNHSEKC